MAEHLQQQRQEEPQSVARLTTEIVVAYVTRNIIAPTDLGDLIGEVGRAVGAVGRESTEPAPASPEPAVPVRLVCLVCGKPQKILRRHLAAAHELMPAAYREQFGLRPDYPMVAPGYSRQRSEMAKRVGLGQRRSRQPRSGA